jgi:hypothetical protein
MTTRLAAQRFGLRREDRQLQAEAGGRHDRFRRSCAARRVVIVCPASGGMLGV